MCYVTRAGPHPSPPLLTQTHKHKQTKETLEKRVAEQDQQKRQRILKMKERERIEKLAAQRFREKQEADRIKMLQAKQDAMASSIHKRAMAIENAKQNGWDDGEEPILYQDRESNMLRVAQVYSQNLQHAHDVRAAKEEKHRQENLVTVENLLAIGDSNGPQTNDDSNYIPPRSGTSMGYRRPDSSLSNNSGLRFIGSGANRSRPSSSGTPCSRS